MPGQLLLKVMGHTFRRVKPSEAFAASTIAQTRKEDRVRVYSVFIEPTIKPSNRALVRRFAPGAQTGSAKGSKVEFVRKLTSSGYRAKLS